MNINLNFEGIFSIKKDGQVIYTKKEVCTLKGEYTSCKSSSTNTLELNKRKQEV